MILSSTHTLQNRVAISHVKNCLSSWRVETHCKKAPAKAGGPTCICISHLASSRTRQGLQIAWEKNMGMGNAISVRTMQFPNYIIAKITRCSYKAWVWVHVHVPNHLQAWWPCAPHSNKNSQNIHSNESGFRTSVFHMFQLCRLHVPCHHSHLSPSKLNSRTKVSQPLKRRHVAAPCCEPCQKNWQASLKPHIPRKQPFHTKISTNPSWTLPDSLVWNPLLPAKIVFIKYPTCIVHVSHLWSQHVTRCHTRASVSCAPRFIVPASSFAVWRLLKFLFSLKVNTIGQQLPGWTYKPWLHEQVNIRQHPQKVWFFHVWFLKSTKVVAFLFSEVTS